MGEIVVAVYRQGALYPLQPLNLQESERVHIQVIPETPVENEVEAAIRVLIAAGLMRPPSRGTPPPDPVSQERRRALADRLGQIPGCPLSAIITEERGER